MCKSSSLSTYAYQYKDPFKDPLDLPAAFGDANRLRLVSALGQFNKSAANAGLSLLFYSGQGVHVFGANYILPIDVDKQT